MGADDRGYGRAAPPGAIPPVMALAPARNRAAPHRGDTSTKPETAPSTTPKGKVRRGTVTRRDPAGLAALADAHDSCIGRQQRICFLLDGCDLELLPSLRRGRGVLD